MTGPRASLPGAAQVRRAEIKSLATYVPPTRAHQRRSREDGRDHATSGSCSAPASASATSSIPASATSDLGEEAALEAIERAGLTPADIDVIIVGTVTPDMLFPSTACLVQAEDRRDQGVGLRPVGAACSAFTYALTVGSQMVAAGAANNVAGDRRRRDVEHHRLHRSRDLRAVRRRRRRRGARAVAGRRDSASSTSSTRSTATAARRCACRPAAASCPASHETVDAAAALREAGRRQAVFKFAVRNTGEICERLLERNGADRERPRPVRLAPGEQAHHHVGRGADRDARREGRHQHRAVRQHHRRRRSRWR